MKKQILVLVGFGDTFFFKDSKKCIVKAEEYTAKIKEILSSGKFSGVVKINEASDTFEYVDVADVISPTSIINMKLCSNRVFNINNEISLRDSGNNSEVLLDGNQLDYLLPPEHYSLFIAGVDINGIFINFIDECKNLGYTTTVFSDIIKPFNKNTVVAIRNSKVKFKAASV